MALRVKNADAETAYHFAVGTVQCSEPGEFGGEKAYKRVLKEGNYLQLHKTA